MTRTRRETQSEATRELSSVKKKTAELESQIEYVWIHTAN